MNLLSLCGNFFFLSDATRFQHGTDESRELVRLAGIMLVELKTLSGASWCIPSTRPPLWKSHRNTRAVSCAFSTSKGVKNKWINAVQTVLGSLALKKTLKEETVKNALLAVISLSLARAWGSRTCNRFASLSFSAQTRDIPASFKWFAGRSFYMMDVVLERYPSSYLVMLAVTCIGLIIIGGIIFYQMRSREQTLGDCLWKAWSCLCSSGTHLKEQTAKERAAGFSLAIGGLMFYSLLTSTLTAQFRSRMELLREGAHFEVMETNHTIVCGVNGHLPTLINQLNKYHALARRDKTASSRKQTVVLLSEKMKSIKGTVLNMCKDCNALNLLSRSGSLSNTSSFQAVGAARASRVILLSRKSDPFEADADIVLSVLALQPLREKNPNIQLIAQVFKEGTADLLKSIAGKNMIAVQDLSSKLLVQCSRQNGLLDVYQKLLNPEGEVISVQNYPALVGRPYSDVRRCLQEVVVCGLVREGSIVFHPKESYVLQTSDKLVIISERHKAQKAPTLLSSTVPSSSSANIVKRSTKPLSKIEWETPRKEYIVVLGWRASVREMVAEYDDYVGRGSELLILAQEPLEKRALPTARLKNIKVTQKVGNPMSEDDLKKAMYEVQGYNSKSNQALSIVVIKDEKWESNGVPECDKQAVYALLLAESVCKELNVKVSSLVAELVDVKIGEQVLKSHRTVTFIGTSELMGLVTAQVADNIELNDIWTDLLNPIGDEIYVKDVFLYMKAGETPSFQELADRAVLRNEVAIGYRMNKEIVINPPTKTKPLRFSEGDCLVVISEFEYQKISKR